MKKLLTVPEVLKENQRVLYAGNHYISIPEIEAGSAAIKSINTISMRNKCLIELSGEETLFKPRFYRNDTEILISTIETEQILSYIPALKMVLEDGTHICVKIYADLSEKGFVYDFESSAPLDIHIDFTANSLCFLRFNKHAVDAAFSFKLDKWLGNPVLDIYANGASLGMAVGGDSDFDFEFDGVGSVSLKLRCNERNAFYIAVNSDTDGASTTLIHLKRKGYQSIYKELHNWLNDRQVRYKSDEGLQETINTNLLFNYFFAIGKDMESDSYVALTSRSPRYYVSGAFWERDSFLWSFPAIRLIDKKLHKRLVRDMLLMHYKNAGDHAHYIDGTVLYPGFELDEAASYFTLLDYINEYDRDILHAVDAVFERIEREYSSKMGLYRTFLLPSDDPAEHPYVTIDNAILWNGLKKLADFYIRAGKEENIDILEKRIEGIKRGIEKYLIKEIQGKLIYIWSTDEAGAYRLYNDPPGNLGLLHYYGFVDKTDEVFKNTIDYYYSKEYLYFSEAAKIKELACDHHPETPSGLGLCGSILNPLKHEEAIGWLKQAPMDHGLLCESFDWNTGEARTGVGFATGSGYLAFALYHTLIGE